ncbi:MAG TPA: restriction endonuclease, SacI family [Microvirga sp.]|nr:restriction endonuclease, SacI family [Microvirga sp.]
MLRIDRAIAERILREEAARLDDNLGDPAWVDHIETLSELCERGRIRTHIAFIGTAILAKCVDARADLKWIKPSHAKDAPFAFSARTLAESVLVPVAADLGIHIGVTSPQPLNNQPYFRMTYLGDNTPISAAGRPAFDFMVKLVRLLESMSEAQSRDALRAFISVRQRYQPRYSEAPGELHVTPEALAAEINQFVSENSEGGKRAQACVAGLFDASFDVEHVESGRINDPSRDHPGDVCVVINGKTVKAIEVKDKPVTYNDVQIFGKKAVDMGSTDAAYVMVSARQERLDDTRLAKWAEGFGLSLTLFYDWGTLVAQSLYWSTMPKRDAAKIAALRIRQRLVDVEAHPETVDRWTSIFAEADGTRT